MHSFYTKVQTSGYTAEHEGQVRPMKPDETIKQAAAAVMDWQVI